MPGEAGKKIGEKFIEQRIKRVKRVVAGELIKAAHGLGAGANLDIRFAIDIELESWGRNRGYVNSNDVSCIFPLAFVRSAE